MQTTITSISHINPSKIDAEEINFHGTKDKLLLKYNGKTIAKFYYNMRGYNPDFVLWNENNTVSYGFSGDRSKTEQIRTFKQALKEGYNNIQNNSNNTMRTHYNQKAIEWSYPTSSNAKRFGFYKTGCYTVELNDSLNYNLPKALKGFSSLQDAIKYADTLPEEYTTYTRRFYNL